MSRRLEWIQDSVEEFNPEDNMVTTSEGQAIKYKYLLVATGAQPDLDSVEGLR